MLRFKDNHLSFLTLSEILFAFSQLARCFKSALTSDCNWTRTHYLAKLANDCWAVFWVLICTVHCYVPVMSHTRLAKWLSVRLRTKWFWVQESSSQSLRLEISCLLPLSKPGEQGVSWVDIQATIESECSVDSLGWITKIWSFSKSSQL